MAPGGQQAFHDLVGAVNKGNDSLLLIQVIKWFVYTGSNAN